MLNPKKPNFLVKELAEELNIPESLVLDVISFYWSTIRKYMESGEEPAIDIESLGIFYVKKNSLEKEIQKNEDYVRVINPTSINKFDFYMKAQQRLKRFYKLKEAIETERANKRAFKENRNETIKQNQKDLE